MMNALSKWRHDVSNASAAALNRNAIIWGMSATASITEQREGIRLGMHLFSLKPVCTATIDLALSVHESVRADRLFAVGWFVGALNTHPSRPAGLCTCLDKRNFFSEISGMTKSDSKTNMSCSLNACRLSGKILGTNAPPETAQVKGDIRASGSLTGAVRNGGQLLLNYLGGTA